MLKNLPLEKERGGWPGRTGREHHPHTVDKNSILQLRLSFSMDGPSYIQREKGLKRLKSQLSVRGAKIEKSR